MPQPGDGSGPGVIGRSRSDPAKADSRGGRDHLPAAERHPARAEPRARRGSARRCESPTSGCRSGCRVCKIATKCRSCSNTLAIDLLVLCAVRAMSGCAMTDSSIHVVLHTLCSVSSLHVSMYALRRTSPSTSNGKARLNKCALLPRATCNVHESTGSILVLESKRNCFRMQMKDRRRLDVSVYVDVGRWYQAVLNFTSVQNQQPCTASQPRVRMYFSHHALACRWYVCVVTLIRGSVPSSSFKDARVRAAAADSFRERRPRLKTYNASDGPLRPKRLGNLKKSFPESTFLPITLLFGPCAQQNSRWL